MFIFGDILITLAKAMHLILGLYQIIILAVIVLTWLKPQNTNETLLKIFSLLKVVTEPVFNWVRQWITKKFGRPPVFNGYDLTPAILWFAIFLVDSLFYMVLMHLGLRMSMGFMEPNMI